MLYIKHKPRNLKEILGNKHIVNSLSQMFENKTFAHLLFEGELGCGKSTLADIVTEKFGVDPHNIIDVNCFDKGIDFIRDIIDNFIHKSSIFGSRKALILDEVHGLSPQAQQILNKEMDNKELIDRIIIIICTTTLYKVNPAFVSRFQHYRVLPLSEDDSKTLIDSVCGKENIKLSKYAKHMIIEKCDGIPRKMLTAIPKLVGIEDKEEITYLLDLSSIEEDEDILDLFKIIFTKGTNWDIIKVKLEKLLKTKSPDSIRIGLMNLISTKIMSKYLKGEEEGHILQKCFLSLKNYIGFPEKSNIIVGVFNIYTENKLYWG